MATKDDCDLLSEDKGELEINLDDIEPSPALLKAALRQATPSTTPELSPQLAPKIVKPPSVPSNPLEAAMFKQMFPDKPKVIMKKSLAEMQAETGTKPTAVSPIMIRRDSRTTDGEPGSLALFSITIGLVNVIDQIIRSI